MASSVRLPAISPATIGHLRPMRSISGLNSVVAPKPITAWSVNSSVMVVTDTSSRSRMLIVKNGQTSA